MTSLLILALLGIEPSVIDDNGMKSPEQISNLQVLRSRDAMTLQCKPRTPTDSDPEHWIRACNELAAAVVEQSVANGSIDPIEGKVFTKPDPKIASVLMPLGSVALKMVSREIELRK